MDNNTIIPRNVDAVPLISIAVQENDRLEPTTLTVQNGMNFSTFRLEPQFVVVKLKNITSHPKPFITIWFNAPNGMTSGGRAVEAGEGPNYYTTYRELKQAIAHAINQLV